jgi:hypothetical protein
MFSVPCMSQDWLYVGARVKFSRKQADDDGMKVSMGEPAEGALGTILDTFPDVVVQVDDTEQVLSYIRLDFPYFWGPAEEGQPIVNIDPKTGAMQTIVIPWGMGDRLPPDKLRFPPVNRVGMLLDSCPCAPNFAEHMERDKLASVSPTLKFLGYWAQKQDLKTDYYAQQGIDLPWPGEFTEPNWDPAERDLVAAYLDLAPDVQYWRGYSFCRLGCGHLDGCTDKSDGTYVWPAGFSHYVRAHNVKPPQEFIQHVRSRGVP